MTVDDALIQAMCESYGQLCSSESYNCGPHFSCAVICITSLTDMNQI